MTKQCFSAIGLISKKAYDRDVSAIFIEGILPLMILQKMLQFIVSDDHEAFRDASTYQSASEVIVDDDGTYNKRGEMVVKIKDES
jgi:hypothetical protein